MDELGFYVPFNSISVISRRWKGDYERLCTMKRRLGSGRISSAAWFEPVTPWSEVGSANRSATRTLHTKFKREATCDLFCRNTQSLPSLTLEMIGDKTGLLLTFKNIDSKRIHKHETRRYWCFFMLNFLETLMSPMLGLNNVLFCLK